MGSGASLPDSVDKPTAKEFAGDKFDEAAFDKAANDGHVSREVLLETAKQVAGAAGSALPAGNSSDKGVENAQRCLSKLLEIKPDEYGTEKLTLRKSFLDDIAEALDMEKNPGAYRICQETVLAAEGSVSLFLNLAKEAKSDIIRVRSLEVLLRLMFGNEAAASAVSTNPLLMPALRVELQRSDQHHEQLATLSLMQALAASPSADVAPAVSSIVGEVVPFVEPQAFAVLQKAALDVIVSCSFQCPGAVGAALQWPFIASLLAEDESRPAWLPNAPGERELYTLTSGFLAVNLLGQPSPEPEDDKAAKDLTVARLLDGSFLQNLLFALDAAAGLYEWPSNTNAFHKPNRLSQVVLTLCKPTACGALAGQPGGFGARLVGAVGPLAKVIETSPDPSATQLALAALRSLSAADVGCLEALIAMEAFRSEGLEALHTSGDVEATELVSYLTSVENSLSAAEATRKVSEKHFTLAPSVPVLARIFARVVPLSQELDQDDLIEALRLVPIGPATAVRATISGDKSKRFSFQTFADHVYGTPNICGWWVSLMEDSAVYRAGLGDVLRLPQLPELLGLYEQHAGGASSVSAESLLEKLLPGAALPTEGPAVEDAFAQLRDAGTSSLEFPAFVTWLGKLCVGLAAEAEADVAES